MNDFISHKELCDVLSYDPKTGIFTWRVHAGPRGTVGSIAGCLRKKGYINIRIFGIEYAAHRLAWFYINRSWPPNQIDHINGTRYDNSIANLRCATNSQNKQNSKIRNDNKTGTKGVSFKEGKSINPYSSRIQVGKRRIHLGYFPTAVAASNAYSIAATKYYGEFARIA